VKLQYIAAKFYVCADVTDSHISHWPNGVTCRHWLGFSELIKTTNEWCHES